MRAFVLFVAWRLQTLGFHQPSTLASGALARDASQASPLSSWIHSSQPLGCGTRPASSLRSFSLGSIWSGAVRVREALLEDAHRSLGIARCIWDPGSFPLGQRRVGCQSRLFGIASVVCVLDHGLQRVCRCWGCALVRKTGMASSWVVQR